MERNTIFNITIQNKRFSSTLLKKKLGKLKWGGKFITWKRKGRQGGTQSGVRNRQTSIHQEAVKTTSEKEEVCYVHS